MEMAPSKEYEILPYDSQYLQKVSELMFHLWGPNEAMNAEYLTWKYAMNPHVDRILGIVAIKGDQVVGFRGFFATKWQAPKGEEFTVLAPGDTCVDPGHRRRGLSIQMGWRAMEEYQSRFRVLLNMSCSSSSIPGYLRMGFKPLTRRLYLTRGTVLGLAAAFLPGRAPVNLRSHLLNLRPQATKEEGEGAIVRSQPLPSAMARVAAGASHGNRLSLVRDEGFFAWRFANNRRYLFHYLVDGDEIVSYLAIRVGRNPRAHVIDHGGRDEDVGSLFEHLIRGGRFECVSVWRSSLSEGLAARLREIGFRHDGISRLVETHIAGDEGLPLLVRPTRIDPCEDDWRVGGLPIDRADSWEIRAIASDAT